MMQVSWQWRQRLHSGSGALGAAMAASNGMGQQAKQQRQSLFCPCNIWLPPSTAAIVLSAVAICHQLLLFYLWLSLLVRWCCCLPPISLSLSPSLPLVLVHALSRSFSLFVPLSLFLDRPRPLSLVICMWYDMISYHMTWYDDEDAHSHSASLALSRSVSLSGSFSPALTCYMYVIWYCYMYVIWYDMIS